EYFFQRKKMLFRVDSLIHCKLVFMAAPKQIDQESSSMLNLVLSNYLYSTKL
ncbi:MAG: hypothetical protein RIS47_1512, partial [Bacteroidota bacterium]